jgi:hypothetical protein
VVVEKAVKSDQVPTKGPRTWRSKDTSYIEKRDVRANNLRRRPL